LKVVPTPSVSPMRGRAIPFTGRVVERGALGRLLDDVRHGASRALVMHGEPGVGKTALLDHLADQASDCRVIRVAGVESEMELAFAGLHQVCAPILDRVGTLPGPQLTATRATVALTATSDETVNIGAGKPAFLRAFRMLVVQTTTQASVKTM
jgi:hypothetical protein